MKEVATKKLGRSSKAKASTPPPPSSKTSGTASKKTPKAAASSALRSVPKPVKSSPAASATPSSTPRVSARTPPSSSGRSRRSRPFQCSACDKFFTVKEVYERHAAACEALDSMSTPDQPAQSQSCGKSTPKATPKSAPKSTPKRPASTGKVEISSDSEGDEAESTRPVPANKSKKKKKKLDDSKSSLDEGRNVCKKCGMSAKTKSDLQRHMALHEAKEAANKKTHSTDKKKSSSDVKKKDSSSKKSKASVSGHGSPDAVLRKKNSKGTMDTLALKCVECGRSICYLVEGGDEERARVLKAGKLKCSKCVSVVASSDGKLDSKAKAKAAAKFGGKRKRGLAETSTAPKRAKLSGGAAASMPDCSKDSAAARSVDDPTLPFKCYECDQAFRTEYLLAVHLELHDLSDGKETGWTEAPDDDDDEVTLETLEAPVFQCKVPLAAGTVAPGH